MNETIKTMWNRKSIREYKSDPIPEKDLTLILETARKAPTGANRQRWRIIVVRDGDVRKNLAMACANQNWMADAPVSLCIISHSDEKLVNPGIVLDQAILAATSLGYGTCWIGAFSEDEVKKVLGIPDEWAVVNLTPIGLSAAAPRIRDRNEPAEMFMQDKFGVALDYDPESVGG